MEGQQTRGAGRRRRRRKKTAVDGPAGEPVLIAARRPGSPLPKGQRRLAIVSAQPKAVSTEGLEASAPTGQPGPQEPRTAKRRAARIVRAEPGAGSQDHLRDRLLDRLVHSEGRGAISRAADDLWASAVEPPKEQAVQIQLLEHEDETRAQHAVFVMAELLQKESPIKRPILDQRLRRLEQSAEDPITRDAARALRRSMRVHHGAN